MQTQRRFALHPETRNYALAVYRAKHLPPYRSLGRRNANSAIIRIARRNMKLSDSCRRPLHLFGKAVWVDEMQIRRQFALCAKNAITR